MLFELHTPLKQASVVYCDTVSAVYLSNNLVQHQRTKHIEIDIHFVRDKVRVGDIRVLHVPSAFQYADIFTKGLSWQLFQFFLSNLSICPPPAQTAGVIIIICYYMFSIIFIIGVNIVDISCIYRLLYFPLNKGFHLFNKIIKILHHCILS
ncbi:putative RNA-directed DNA polymerase [Helianthus anomalus]